MLLGGHCGGWKTAWQTKRLSSCKGKRERERALDTDMADGIAARSRDVYAAVEQTDSYGGFKEVLLEDRGFPRLMHIAVQTSPLCLAYRSARLLGC